MIEELSLFSLGWVSVSSYFSPALLELVLFFPVDQTLDSLDFCIKLLFFFELIFDF
jgi:hypothetical protein